MYERRQNEERSWKPWQSKHKHIPYLNVYLRRTEKEFVAEPSATSTATITTTTTATASISDYYRIILLLHGNNPIADSSEDLRPLALRNGVTTTSSPSIFGSVIKFDGTDDDIVTLGTSSIEISSTAFTAELLVWPQNRQRGHLVGQYEKATFGGRSWHIFVETTGVVSLRLVNHFSALFETVYSSTTLSLSAWSHIAVARGGNDNLIKLFINGVKQEAEITYSLTLTSSLDRFYIGNGSNVTDGVYFKGFMDEIRVTRGKAWYTTDFTPPTTEHPDP